MAEIALPELPKAPTLRGIIIDRVDLAREDLFSVTMWLGGGRAPKRRWFTSRPLALAFAAENVDELGLLLVDLSEQVDDQ